MSGLHALVYVSRAAHVLSLVELDAVLQRAQVRNAQLGVTGVLLHTGGQFMQYIEGPADAMGTIYGSIKADRRHHGIIELLREEIPEREYPPWSMAFRSSLAWRGGPAGQNSGPALTAVALSRPALYEELQFPGPSTSAARTLLTKFWNRARAPAAF